MEKIKTMRKRDIAATIGMILPALTAITFAVIERLA